MKASSLTIENFKELIDSNAYYVDKTQLIIDYIKERRVLFKMYPVKWTVK